MSQVNKVFLSDAEHYTWGACDGWHLLKSDTLSVIRERMPPGTSEAMHHHNKSQQVFYILSGVALFEVEGKVLELHAHESLHIPVGVKHQIRNESDVDLEFLVISEPMAHGDRVTAH